VAWKTSARITSPKRIKRDLWQVFLPAGNVLPRAGRRDPASGAPDSNAVVTVEPAIR
jgi:hypothetical protein